MGNMLRGYEVLVKDILTDNKESRGNDRRLYLELLKTTGYDTSVSIEQFFLDDDYPNLESIRRVRQKIQEKVPELRPDDPVRKARGRMKEEYLDLRQYKEKKYGITKLLYYKREGE